jgi:hypothetical protein
LINHNPEREKIEAPPEKPKQTNKETNKEASKQTNIKKNPTKYQYREQAKSRRSRHFQFTLNESYLLYFNYSLTINLKACCINNPNPPKHYKEPRLGNLQNADC